MGKKLKGHNTLLGLKEGSHNISSIYNTKGFISMYALAEKFINCAKILDSAGERQADLEARRLLFYVPVTFPVLLACSGPSLSGLSMEAIRYTHA